MSTRTTVTVPSNLAAFSYNKTTPDLGGDETTCCVLCGRNAGQGGRFVYLTNLGEYTTVEEAAQNDKVVEERGGCPDDLGLYPVGSDCAKKLKQAGVTIYNWQLEPL